MKKKSAVIKLDTFRGDSIKFFLSQNKKFDNPLLEKVFTQKEINKIDKDFNNFYRLVYDHCLDDELKLLLKKLKKRLRLNYYTHMLLEVGATSIYAQLSKKDISIKKDQELRAVAIWDAKMKLFFFADVVIAFAFGDKDILNDLRTELNRVINLRRTYDVELLKKIKEIELEKRKVIPKPTQIECVILANRELKEKHFKESYLVDDYGHPTQLAINIRDAYKSQKKSL